MPPNFNDVSVPPVNFVEEPKENGPSGGVAPSSTGAGLKATRSVLTLVTHMLIGIITGSCIVFAFRAGSELNSTNQHILLCTLGYQFLMAEAILGLAPDSWLSTLNLKHKRWIHWIMQIVGSTLALAGSFIMIQAKTIHWNTLHGQFSLVAMVFTTVSLVNGITSLYAYELRRIIPGILSKLTHICFGIVAMGAASISLCYGMDKNSFRTWATSDFAEILIALTGVFTVLVIVNPFIVFSQKLIGAVKN